MFHKSFAIAPKTGSTVLHIKCKHIVHYTELELVSNSTRRAIMLISTCIHTHTQTETANPQPLHNRQIRIIIVCAALRCLSATEQTACIVRSTNRLLTRARVDCLYINCNLNTRRVTVAFRRVIPQIFVICIIICWKICLTLAYRYFDCNNNVHNNTGTTHSSVPNMLNDQPSTRHERELKYNE